MARPFLVLAILWTTLAYAQPQPQPMLTETQRYVQASQQALRSGQIELAREELEKAYLLEGSPLLLEPLGRIALLRQDKVLAGDLFRRFLIEANPKQQEAILLQVIATAEGSATEVSVRGRDGAFLRVDGQLVGRFPLSRSILLSPGTHRLRHCSPACGREHVTQVRATVPLSIVFSPTEPDLVVENPDIIVLILYAGQLHPSEQFASIETPVLNILRRNTQVQPLDTKRADELLRSEPATCLAQRECRLRVARRLGTRYIIEFKPTEAVPSSTQVEVTDVTVGELSATTTCVDCATGKSADQLNDVVRQALGQAMSRIHGELQISSQPSGARIRLNGQEFSGRTPQRLLPFAEQYVVSIHFDDFLPVHRTVTIDPVTPVVLDVKLVPNPAATRRRRFTAAKWTLVAAGALMLAGGVTAFAINRTLRADETNPKLLSWPFGVAALLGGAISEGAAALLWRYERASALEARVAEQ